MGPRSFERGISPLLTIQLSKISAGNCERPTAAARMPASPILPNAANAFCFNALPPCERLPPFPVHPAARAPHRVTNAGYSAISPLKTRTSNRDRTSNSRRHETR